MLATLGPRRSRATPGVLSVLRVRTPRQPMGNACRFAAWVGHPGQGTDAIQNRIYQANVATMTQTNDYPFNAAGTALTANPDITVYGNGQLIYGTGP